MVADVLAPNRHQFISNHHPDSSSVAEYTSSHQPTSHNIIIASQLINKSCVQERSVGRQPVGSLLLLTSSYSHIDNALLPIYVEQPWQSFIVSCRILIHFFVKFGNFAVQFLSDNKIW